MTGSMSRYLAIPEQTPAIIFVVWISSEFFFHMIYLRTSLLYHNTLMSLTLRKHKVDNPHILKSRSQHDEEVPDHVEVWFFLSIESCTNRV